jgi:hypothetical protein
MNEYRIPKVLKMTLRGKYSTGRLTSRWKQKVSKDVAEKKEHGRKLRKNLVKSEADDPM